MGIAGSSAKATYANGERQLTLSITDTGGLAGLAAMAGWANMTMDKETDGKVEKVYKDGARTVHEEYRKDGSHGEVTVDPRQWRDRRGRRQPDRRRDAEKGARRPRPGPDRGDEASGEIGGRYPCFRFQRPLTTPEVTTT